MPNGGWISFFHKLGAGPYWVCDSVESGEGVVLEAKWNGQNTYSALWSSNEQLSFYKEKAQFVNVSIPPRSGASSVELRFRQLGTSSDLYDEWMLDEVTAAPFLRTFCVSYIQPSCHLL
jgi:hypothetical protein